jgi:hypothetical protein
MLLIGNGCLSHAEEQTQMALWSIFAAPLIMGNDLRNVSAESKAILLNKAAIAVDQDPLGKMGRRVNTSSESEIWMRELEGGAVAVALFNKNGGAPAGIKLIEEGACESSLLSHASLALCPWRGCRLALLLLLLPHASSSLGRFKPRTIACGARYD